MSLAGRRILVTRAPHQVSELAELLRAAGAVPVLVPTIEIVPPESFCALDAALACLRSYDWLVFTSANAVEAFHRRAQTQRLTQMPRKIAAIGPATAKAVNGIGLAVDLLPAKYVAESLAEALAPDAPGKSFLLVRAAAARDTLPEALTAAGATVTIAEAYRNQTPAGSTLALKELFATPSESPDAVAFTSGSTVRNLVGLLEGASLVLPERVLRASIGPITSNALRELGQPPHFEAKESTIPSLVAALADYFDGQE